MKDALLFPAPQVLAPEHALRDEGIQLTGFRQSEAT